MSGVDRTQETYDSSAELLAEYFRGRGPRTEVVEKGFELAGVGDGQGTVLELGCGDGRDAIEITRRAGSYVGIDYSAGMIAIAQRTLPESRFEVADMVEYDYPENVDVIFAFASILHLNPSQLHRVLIKAHAALRVGGVIIMESKHKSTYSKEAKEDQFGLREFYYYNPDLVQQLAGPGFESAYEDYEEKGSTTWFMLGLKKT